MAAIATEAAAAEASPAPVAAGSAAVTVQERPVPAANQPYAGRDDVRAFAAAMALERGLDGAWTLSQLNQARYIPQVAKLMMPPPAGSAKDWAAYRARFVEPKRISAGLEFWRSNQKWIDKAQERWGVPGSVIVGIVGVETFYGRVTGNFRVLDALATLSFDFPTGRRDRTPFFRAQLEAFLQSCQRSGIDPTTVLGSYAGAMGLPQFMPSSVTSYAVDFDEDGRIDLSRSHADVIGSVAHYLAAHGWQRDVPAYYSVAAPANPSDRATLLEPDILPTFTPEQMQARGAVLKAQQARMHSGRMALVELQNGTKAAPSYVAGTENFYAVTRYNWSSYYAMAVIDLGDAVAQAHAAAATAVSARKVKLPKQTRIAAQAQ